MEKLLKLGVLPIINENDTVSTAELEYDQSLSASAQERVFGDNDRLAALVMSKLEADALVLLTNVDGLLLQQPKAANVTQTVSLRDDVKAADKVLGSTLCVIFAFLAFLAVNCF